MEQLWGLLYVLTVSFEGRARVLVWSGRVLALVWHWVVGLYSRGLRMAKAQGADDEKLRCFVIGRISMYRRCGDRRQATEDTYRSSLTPIWGLSSF